MVGNVIDVKKLEIGYSGTAYFNESGNLCFDPKYMLPYVIYRIEDNMTDNGHIGTDMFSSKKYYFFGELRNDRKLVDKIDEECVISKSYSIKFVCGSDTISFSELRSIYCNFNLLDALIKSGNDNYLILLKKHLDNIDLMEEGNVKDYYMNKIFSLIISYINRNGKDTNSIIREIYILKDELENEKKKVNKTRKKIINSLQND